jgi:adenosylcobinamide-GDP ribazoletransferase
MTRFLAALQFLTIIAVPWRREVQADEIGRSAGYFPLIGLIIGLILVGLNLIFGLLLPPAVANVLLIAFLVIISGAMHLDGFADTCDGLVGHRTVEERWRVMRDSRAGAYGIVGVVLILLLKYVTLSSIRADLMLMALILMPVISRWTMTYAIFVYRYARPDGLGKAFKEGMSWPRFTLATVIAVAVAAGIGQLVGLAIMFFCWLVTLVIAAYFKGKFNGLTGDNYGAINEVAEVSVLVFVIILAQFGLA